MSVVTQGDKNTAPQCATAEADRNGTGGERASKPMKILHMVGVPNIGGTETHSIAVVEGLIKRGHDAMMANTWDDSLVNTYAERAGIPFAGLRGGTYKLGPRWFSVVGRFLRKERFDIVQTHGLRMSFGVRMIQRYARIKHHIYCIRGLDRQRRKIETFFDRLTERRLSLILCNSQAVADRRTEVAGTKRERMMLIPNGIDVDYFRPDVPQESRESLNLPQGFLFVKVASFREEKDHATLFESMKIAGDALDGAKVVLVGGGAFESQVRASADQFGVSSRVIFHGIAKDVRPLLRSCDAYVMSSHSEGMPRAVMEAMAMGLPVVTTAAGGVAEVAEDEKSALIVPTRDPSRLANAMIRVYRNPQLRSQLGRDAVRRIREHFSLELMLDRYEGIYRSVLHGSTHHWTNQAGEPKSSS